MSVVLESMGGSLYSDVRREFGLLVFRSSLFNPTRSLARRRATAAHEIGHTLGLPDGSDITSTMYYSQLHAREYRRIDQRWSDAELRTALQNIFADGTPPPWL